MLRWLLLWMLFFPVLVFAQNEQVWLHPNRGQWDERISYKVELDNGSFLIEPRGFTFHFYEHLTF